MNSLQSFLTEIRTEKYNVLSDNLIQTYLNQMKQGDKEAREKLAYEYEHQYGPLCLQNGVVNGSWQWTNGPWPWESEAN